MPVRYSVLLIIFLTPLLSLIGSFGYEQSKVIFFILSIGIIFPILSWYKKINFFSKLLTWQLLFLLVLAVTSLLGINPHNSLFGVDPYYQGIILYISLFLFSLIISYSNIKLELFALCLVSSASFVSIVALKEWVSMNYLHQAVLNYAGRVGSTFGQPNFYAGFVLMTIPFSYLLIHRRDKLYQLAGFASLLLSCLAILVSQSRTAQSLLILLALIWLFSQVRSYKKALIVFFVTVFIVSIVLSNFSSGFVWQEFTSNYFYNKFPDLTSDSVEKRPYIWVVGLQVAAAKPMMGYGLDNIDFAYPKYFQDNKHQLFEENPYGSPVMLSIRDLIIDRSHNYLLDLLLFSGILGVVAWVVLISVAFTSTRNNTLKVCLVSYLIWVQFQNQSVVQLIYFWLILGLINKKIGASEE